MATERKTPNSLIVQTNLTGNVTAIVEDPNYGDASWLTAVDETATSICHVSFGTPSGNPTVGPGFQEFKILARLTATATPCAYSVDLYESGVPIANIAAGTLSSTTAQLITAVWDAAQLGTANGSAVEVLITIVSSGDTSGEIGAIEWNVTYTPAGPADTIREKILQSLEAQLKEITTANGYDFNVASTSVERARRVFFDDELPAIGIFDGDETLAGQFGSIRSDMLVSAELHVDAGATNRSIVMNRMKAALDKAIMSADGTHGGFAGSTNIAGYQIRYPEDDDSKRLTVVAVARINYMTVTGNPWANP